MVGRALVSHLVAIRLKAPSYLRDMIKETTTEKCTEVSKSQTIRLVDVFVIAPFLAYVAFKAKGISKGERLALYGLSIATAFYNGRNFLETRQGRP